MSTKPLFSVIIPTYNRVTLLKRALESVICQTFTDWEIIVIDDGSTDNTAEMVNAFQEPKIRYSVQHHGERSRARNQGIVMAQGQYICFLDDDDEYKPAYLQDFYKYYRENNFPKTILRTGFVKQMGEKEIKTSLYDQKKDGNPVHFAAFQMCGVWTLSIPADCLLEDNFHPDFPHWQDTHLVLRLFARHNMVQLQGFNYIYHVHPDMGSRKMAQNIEEKLSLNLTPIHHLFDEYDKLLKPFLPDYTRSYLIAKKYIEFAHIALVSGQKKRVITYLSKSLQTHISLRFCKNYLVLIRDFFRYSF